jgi:hypothetical protein
MGVEVFPQPAEPTVAESYGMAFTAQVYSNIAEGDDITTINQTLISLDSVKTLTPGVYESVGTHTGIARWSLRVSTNPTVVQTINVGTNTTVGRFTTTGTLFANASVQWRNSAVLPINSSTGRLGQPAYANGFIVVPASEIDGGGNVTPYINVSTNGQSWSQYLPAANQFTGITPFSVNIVNNRWVVSLSNGRMSTSTDLVNWATGNDIGSSNMLNSIASNGTRLVGSPVDTANILFTSTDAINWSTVASGVSTRLRRVRYVNNFWFAMGDGGRVCISTNGINWNASNVQSLNTATEPITDVCFGNGRYVMVSQFGNINTSTDGINWTTAPGFTRLTDNSSRRFYVSLFNNGRFFLNGWNASGTSGRFYTSTDGLNFSDITSANTSGSMAQANFAQGIVIPTSDVALRDYTWMFWAIGVSSQFISTANIDSERFQNSWSRNLKGSILTTLTSATLKQVAPLNVNYTTSL